MEIIKEDIDSLPENILIMLTTQRSGSTWLFDTLRADPAIDVLEKELLFTFLGIDHANRYPYDLEDENSGKIIKNNAKKSIRIPEMEITDETRQIVSGYSRPVYCIEKLHPHFSKELFTLFISRFNELVNNKNVKIIYSIREPVESLYSFVNYQTRSKMWYKDLITDADVINLYSEDLLKLSYLYKTFGGYIIDYSTLQHNAEQVLNDILKYLWPDNKMKKNDIKKLTHEMMMASVKEKKENLNTPFIGQSTVKAEAFRKRILDNPDTTLFEHVVHMGLKSNLIDSKILYPDQDHLIKKIFLLYDLIKEKKLFLINEYNEQLKEKNELLLKRDEQLKVKNELLQEYKAKFGDKF